MRWLLKKSSREVRQAAEELKILKQDILAAKEFLKQNRKKFFHAHRHIDKYLVMGSSHAGKTTFLSQSGLALVDNNMQPLKNVAPTKNCSWWFSPNTIFLDTAGMYTKPEIERPRDEIIWRGFLTTLKKNFGKTAIDGVLVILDLAALATDQGLLSQTLFYLRDRIYEISQLIPNFPLYIIFTKCDHIAGFNTFFEHLEPEQRQQAFGISFAHNMHAEVPRVLDAKIDVLLERLNNYLLPRLQQEHQKQQRQLLVNFPLQIESLRPLLHEVVNKIPSSNNIKLQGIFFTSSIQEGSAIDYLQTPIENFFHIEQKPIQVFETQSRRSFFIEDICKKIIAPRNTIINKEQLKTRIKIGISAILATLLLTLSLFFWYENYTTNAQAINATVVLLQNQNNLNDAVKLQDLNTLLTQKQKSLLLILGSNKISVLKKIVNSITQFQSFNSFLTEMQQDLESELTSSASSTSPRRLYAALKTYLMLGDHSKYDESYVKEWFRNYWSVKFPNILEKQIKLQETLDQVLQLQNTITVNPKIVSAARQTLQEEPVAQLIYLSLENKHLGQNLLISTNKINSIFSNLDFHISMMYTAENFSDIYNKAIEAAINNPTINDWVLGDSYKITLTNSEKVSMRSELKEIYLANYAAAWEAAIKDVPIDEFSDIKQATLQLKNLADTTSPLLQFLHLVKANTSFNEEPDSLTKQLNSKLHGLNQVDLTTLQNYLTNLASLFNNIETSPNLNKEAFNITAKHFQDSVPQDSITLLQIFAVTEPKPVQAWLLAITANCWKVLLNATQVHIANAWKESVVPEYQKTLQNKYPLFKNADVQIPLEDFAHFFANHGIIEQFFDTYLKPFVDVSQMYWVWKDSNGSKIGFTQNTLEVFIRAGLIQKMFFGEKSQTPQSHFVLSAKAMTPTTKKFTLNLEGQTVEFEADANKSENLVWPGPVPGEVSIEFINKDDKHFVAMQNGPWAWFKILDKANLQAEDVPGHFALIFDLNANAAKYELIVNGAVNPFVPGILSEFRVPEMLN